MKCVDFFTQEQAFKYLCEAAAQTVSDALRERGQAHLVLSGGRSPRLYLPQLARTLGDWSDVCVSLSDERWVLPTHRDSNEGMVREHFVKHAPGARLVGMVGACRDAPDDARSASQAYEKLFWPADVSLLGVGSDGHIASLFPGFLNGAGAILVTHQAGSGQARLSLSPQKLLMTRKVLLLANGVEKHRVVTQAMEAGSDEQFPLHLLLCQDKVPVEILMC